MNLRTLDWDDELLEILAIPRAMLPAVRPSCDQGFYGKARVDGPVGGEVPVCGDLGDQQAALFGQTCYDVGEAKNTYGMGCFKLLNTGPEPIPSQSGLLATWPTARQQARSTHWRALSPSPTQRCSDRAQGGPRCRYCFVASQVPVDDG